MGDEKADRMIALLEEIRTLQQQHNEAYQGALRNQAESIALQKKAMARFMALLVPIVLVVLIAIVVVLLLSSGR